MKTNFFQNFHKFESELGNSFQEHGDNAWRFLKLFTNNHFLETLTLMDSNIYPCCKSILILPLKSDFLCYNLKLHSHDHFASVFALAFFMHLFNDSLNAKCHWIWQVISYVQLLVKKAKCYIKTITTKLYKGSPFFVQDYKKLKRPYFYLSSQSHCDWNKIRCRIRF